MAGEDKRLVAITPAMCEGSGLVGYRERFPDRYIDVGIAEQHAVTLAAGMACDGLKPVVAIYSTFLQRAYDQLIHDVALQNLPVMFAVDRAGIVGADGPTHTGAYDISFLRCIPNMVIMTPSDEQECRRMLTTAYLHDGPAVVRYPRGKATGIEMADDLSAIPFAQARTVRQRRDAGGNGIALLVFGTLLATAKEVAEELDATVYDMRYVKPLDTRTIDEAAGSHDLLVTIEDNAIAGGAGSAVAEHLSRNNDAQDKLTCRLHHIGFPDRIIQHGESRELLAEWGLDKTAILATISQWIASNHHIDK
jgi:1-deoxy-D-xylulose-5-phosphate synthase